MLRASLPLPKAPLTSASAAERRKECRRGFTLIELVIVLAMLGTLAGIGLPTYANYLEKAKIARAMADVGAISTDLRLYMLSSGELPDSLAQVGRGTFLDPWQNPYEYLKIACAEIKQTKKKKKCTDTAAKGMRKDKFLKPLNFDYDLYSRGKDGATVPPLNAGPSRDDIVRANNGAYIGLASAF
ncbi:MAG: type II secretion system protein [Nitrospiraceae bacterium]